MELTDQDCPHCGDPFGSDRIDAAAGIATCGRCMRVTRVGPAQPRRRPETRPHFTVETTGPGISFAWPWFRRKHLGLLVFAVMVAVAIVKGDKPDVRGRLLVGLVETGLVYLWLAYFLNRTRVAVEGRALSIRHGPVPWAGNRTLEASAIDQLYCVRRESNSDDGLTVWYVVCALLKSGAELELVKNLDTPDEALFIEHELERHLDLRDWPMPGELPR